MSQVVETIDVEVPVTVAYNEWTQFESFPRFLSFVEQITQTDESHSHWKVRVAGVEKEFDTVITEQHPDERIAWTSTGGEVDHAGVITFHRLSDSSSRLAVQIDWRPESLLEKAGAVLNVDDNAVKRSLRQFKEVVEREGNSDGAWRGDISNDSVG